MSVARSAPLLAIGAAAVLGGLVGGALVWWLLPRWGAGASGSRRTIARRIILVRHGESEGNVDRRLFQEKADHLIPLTEKGKAQARAAGESIKQIVGNSPLVFFVSPYERTRGTFRELRSALHGNRILKVREEPCIREQDFGNFQDSHDQEDVERKRNKYGRFFFRIPQGESGADVIDRVSIFLDSLFRSFKRGWFDECATIIIVTHGLTLRLFLMRYFHWSVELFERTCNPGNAEFVVLERVHEDDCYGQPLDTYKLTSQSARVIGLSEHECNDADFVENTHREALGRPDIHIPALALSPSKPLPPALSHRMESPASAPGHLLVELARDRDVLPAGGARASGTDACCPCTGAAPVTPPAWTTDDADCAAREH